MIKKLFPLILMALAYPAAAVRAAEPVDATVRVEIPAGDLTAALASFARQAGVELVYRTEQLKGLKTRGVHGTLSAREAVTRLLEGTSLTFRTDPTGAMMIAAPRSAAETGPSAKAGVPGAATVQPVDMNSLRLAAGEEPSAANKPDDKAAAAEHAEEVVVTGTRETGLINQGIIPREENQAVRYTVIRREDIERSGLTTMPELMRRLSSNQETGVTSQRGYAASVTGFADLLSISDQVNLRGFGPNQTLVMINGRRIYGSDAGAGPDISRIPLSAVERIEILPSSGSAIYGGNSVGGVINVVMRQGYRGTDTDLYVGSSTEGGAGEYRLNLFHGASFNDQRTSLTAALSFQRQDDFTRGQRDFDSRILSTPYAQPGSPGFAELILPAFISPRPTVIDASGLGLGIPSDPEAMYASVPTGVDTGTLTPDSFDGTANTAVISRDRISRSKLRQASHNYSIMFNLEQRIRGDALQAYAELTWREDDSAVRFPFGLTQAFLAADDPRNPFRNDVTPGFEGRDVIIYRDPANLPDSYQSSTRRTTRLVAGFKGKWQPGASRAYNWAADVSWDRNETETDGYEYGWGLDSASLAGAYDLLADLTGAAQLPQSELDKHRLNDATHFKPVISAINLRVNGDLFELWGGPAKFSLGSEARREQYFAQFTYPYIGEYNCAFLSPEDCREFFYPADAISIDRSVFAVYGEAVAPLVGPKNRKPWLYSLELSAGMRYEKYDDFRAAMPPLLGIKLGLTPDFALRASYAEGFQPPSVSQLNQPVSITPQSGAYADPLRPGAVNPVYSNIRTGNPDLKPERAETWDAGIILTPRALPGLTLNASYFRYNKKDNIVALLPVAQAIIFFPEFIVRGPQSPADIAANRPGPVIEYHSKPVNLARAFTDGVDLNLRYSLPAASWGQLTLTSSSTWTKRFFTQPRPNQSIVDSLGLAGFLGAFTLDRRGTASAIWSREAWSASATANYVGSFETLSTTATARNPLGSGVDGDRIPSQTTLDLQLEYRFDDGSGQSRALRSWLGGTRWAFGALNVFNTAPALWSDSLRGYTSPFVDQRQRFIYLQARKAF